MLHNLSTLFLQSQYGASSIMEKQAYKLRADIVYATEEALLSETVCYAASRGGTSGEQQHSNYQGGSRLSTGDTAKIGSPSLKAKTNFPNKNNRRSGGGAIVMISAAEDDADG